ncbi:MAG: P-II family nitrogen regulator [Verrucomicrobiota bacterium]|nr:P-II family nitrogen regulator [Verrucomicrobiota bacterium]
MKEIKAYFRPACLDSILDVLEEAGATAVTVIRVDALGRLADPENDQHHLVRKYREKYSAVVKLELVCKDEDASRFAEIIREGASTGKPGDGRIFVHNIETAINIRTGVTGESTL